MAPSDGDPISIHDQEHFPPINSTTPNNPNLPSYVKTIATSSKAQINGTRQLRESVLARQSTHNGMPAVIFKAKDYCRVMDDECRLTIVEKFLKPRPQIEKIRFRFKELFPVKGSTKIGVFDNYNVFLDFTNEDDFNTVWFK
ncbi:hypothetical protein P3S67_014344 [Capsicum chacoense]